MVQVLLVSTLEALLSRLMLRRDPQAPKHVQRLFCAKAYGTVGAKKPHSTAELDTAAEVYACMYMCCLLMSVASLLRCINFFCGQ